MTNTLTRPEWDLTPVPYTPEQKKRQNKLVALWTAGIALVAGVVIALVLVLSSHGAGVQTNSQSYRDGYASANDSAPGGGPNSCSELSVWDIPAGDNGSQWMAGCQAGQNSANFNSQHPGASGNS
jgi:hypothetical protein